MDINNNIINKINIDKEGRAKLINQPGACYLQTFHLEMAYTLDHLFAEGSRCSLRFMDSGAT